MTNAERIRSMDDEELADLLNGVGELDERIHFCQNLPECAELLDTEEGVPEHRCKECLAKWLRQETEDGNA